MNIQNIVTDVRKSVESAGKNTQDAFKTYIDTQRQAVTLVRSNGQSLANTEIGAAKNIYASAKAGFERARADGLRKIANDPQAYLPSGRAQIVSAYKVSIDLLVKTGNELSGLVASGYKNILDTLAGKPPTTQRAKTKSAPRKAKSVAKSASKTAAAKADTAAAKTKAAANKTKKAASGAAKSASTAAPTKATKRKTTTTRAKKTAPASSTSS